MKNLVALAAFFALSSGAQAQTNCSVNWSQNVATAGSFSYGLNAYNGYNPDVAGETGSAIYKTNIKFMNPGILRYHRNGEGQMTDSTLNPSGWVINPDTAPQWDRAKIRSALRTAYAGFYPVKLMNIVNWPAAWKDSSGQLKTDKYDDYAEFCADLVRAINVEMGPDYAIDYWEVTNELDNIYSGTTGAGAAAQIYNQAASRMRELRNGSGGYPTKNGTPLKIGGAGFANTYYDNSQYLNTFVHEWVRLTLGKVDFLSYHQYSTQTGAYSDAEYFKRASELGGATNRVRKSVDLLYGTNTKPLLFHDEWNLFANAQGTNSTYRAKQSNIVGAIFDAIGLAAITKAKANGSMAWNEGDGWYGKLNNDANWTKKPGAYVFNLYNAHLRGSVATTTTSAATAITIYAAQSSGKKAFALINQINSSQALKMTFSGTTPANYRAYRITSAAPDPGSGFAVSSSSLVSGVSLPGYSITVFVQDGTATLQTALTSPSVPTF